MGSSQRIHAYRPLNMLDIICTAVLRDGEKLYKHFKSIDHPIKRYFIIDNSCGTDSSITKALDTIYDEHPSHIEQIYVLETVQNTGYAGAVNLAIKQNTDCNHWIFTGFDWYPKPGQLQLLADNIAQHPTGLTLGQGNDEMCGLVLTPTLINRVGLLDENFHPGYYEDNDYRYRQFLTGVRMGSFPLQNEHITSSTLNSTTHFKQRNKVTFSKNFDYYVEKWGGPPGRELYRTPFNQGYPIDYWKYDPTRTQELRWT